MIYDRPYMQQDPGQNRQMSVLAWVIVATIAAFVVQQFFASYTDNKQLMETWFGLSMSGIKTGFLWQFVSYSFLHGSIFHIVFNLLGVFFIGREVLRNVGPKRFLGVYFGSVIVGAIAWIPIATFLNAPAVLLGSSAAVFGLLTVFLLTLPDRPVTFLLFFIIPATLRPRHLALGLLGISVFGLLFWEIPGGGGIAHSSHLGGMLAGWLYLRYLDGRANNFGGLKPGIEMPAWLKKKKPSVSSNYQVNVKHPADLKTEVDRILDKINSQGFGSLTDDERRMLDEARESLNKN